MVIATNPEEQNHATVLNENPITIWLLAGEASGDNLGAKLVKELRKLAPKAIFKGIGGEQMRAAGVDLQEHVKNLSVMGFFEVIPHIPRLLKIIRHFSQAIVKEQPDIVITIDAPDLNFRIVRKAQKWLGNCSKQPKFVHYVAPSVWAYREYRAAKIAKNYDMLLALLPFEPPYFTRYGLPTIFIGHPIVEDFTDQTISSTPISTNNNMADNHIVIMPGSRISEVKRHMPTMMATIKILIAQHNVSFTFVTLPWLEPQIKSFIPADLASICHIVSEPQEKHQALSNCQAVMVKAGTGALEVSCYAKPHLIFYQTMPLTAFLARLWLKIKHVHIINLMAGQTIIPEFLQENCEPEQLAAQITEFLENNSTQQKYYNLIKPYLDILGLHQDTTPSAKAALAVLGLIKNTVT